MKGYATHERGTLEAVMQARNMADCRPVARSAGAGRRRDPAVRRARQAHSRSSEAYPDLKANTNFQQLQAQLSDIENKLAAARRFFNNAVSEFNARIQQFPAALFAGIARIHAAARSSISARSARRSRKCRR